MENILQYKSVFAGESVIKDVDPKQGRITGYFSVFGNKDSDDDVIMPGAFKKTLSESMRRVKHLYQHDPWRPLSGTKDNKLIVAEDGYGLYFDSTISQTSWGRDTIKLYEDGVIDEQSIGFQIVKSNDREGYRELTELKLWEGSSVTWGANEMARTKSVFTIDGLSKKMDVIIKSLRNGKYENEDVFDQLELYFKQLQQLFIEITTEPKQSSSTLPEEKNDLLGALTAFNKTFKSAENGRERNSEAA